MCRHLAYLGPELCLNELLTTGPRSLYEQSWAPQLQRYGTVNGDGFGVGWHLPEPGGELSGELPDSLSDNPPGEPPRYRRAIPVWADPNLQDLLRTIRSASVIAAVRSASEGTTQDESAAAPFRSGRWLFSHNGAIPEWTTLPVDDIPPADLLAMEARSDSALLWALVSGRLRSGGSAAEAVTAVVDRIADARPASRLNLLLTDGRTITATRHGDTLWYRTAPGSVVVASEPCDTLPGWLEVPDNALLSATRTEVRITERNRPS